MGRIAQLAYWQNGQVIKLKALNITKLSHLD
jgi:hypothetical protein